MAFERSGTKICIRSAIESEADDISDFLEKHFSSGNPMELAYIYNQEDDQKPDEHSDFILKAIIDEHVMVAIELSTMTLVGVLIADTIDSKSNGHLISSSTSTSSSGGEKRADIPNFLAYISAKLNICHRFNVDKYFQIEIVGVHQDYREQQVGHKLFEAGIDLAKSKNCKLVSVDCVNVYSSKIAEKLGMECASIVSYGEYNDHLGKCLFVPIPPHMDIKTFIKKL